MNSRKQLLFTLRSMTVYRGVLKNPVVRDLMALLECGESAAPRRAAERYGRVSGTLRQYGMTLNDYIYQTALYDENCFTRQCAQGRKPTADICEAVRRDLRALGALANVQPAEIFEQMMRAYPDYADAIGTLPSYRTGNERYVVNEKDWGGELSYLEDFCRENGCGMRAKVALHGEAAAEKLYDALSPELRQELVRTMEACL